MNRGRFRALGAAAVVVLALAIAGCGGGESSSPQAAERGGVLHMTLGADPETLAPTTAILEPAVNIVSQINEPLFTFSAQGKVEPLLATSLKIAPNGLTYTVSLRPNVQFSDGKPLTAKDVVFSLDQARKSVSYESFYEAIKTVEAKSDSDIVIRTTRPMPEMEADLSLWVTGIVPVNYGGMTAEQFSQHPIGTGPFTLKSWTKGSSVTLERNPNYWQTGKPLLNEVVLQVVPDPNSALAQVKGGQEQAVSAPAAAIASLEQTPGLVLGPNPLNRADILQLNLHNPLFADPQVREAANLAVDREGIVAAALGGRGEPAGSFLPPVLPFVDEGIKPPAQDLARAKSLLAAAVKERNLDPGFTLMSTANDPYAISASQILQQNLSEAGFDVNIRTLDPGTVYELTAAGEYDATISSYYPAAPSPSELVSYYLSSIAGPAGAEVGPLERLAQDAAQQLDAAKREKLYHELQEAVAEEHGTIALDYQPLVWVLADSVQEFEVNPLNVVALRNTWITH